MPQVVSTAPSDTGVGQVLTYDDGTTSYDPYMSYNSSAQSADPSQDMQPAPAPQPAVAAPQSAGAVDPMTGQPIPDVSAPDGVGSLGRGIGRALEIPPLAAPEAGTAPAGAPPPGDSSPLADASRHFQGLQPEQSGGLSQDLVTLNLPGQAGHWQPTQTSRSYIDPKAAAGMNATVDEMQRRNDAAVSAEEKARNRLADTYSNHSLDAYLRAQAEDLAAQAMVKKNQLDQERIKAKIDDAMAFKPDRHQLFEGTGGGIAALGAAIAMIAGGALSGLRGGTNQGADLVMHMVDENVKQQVAQNTMFYQELRSRLGDDQAAAGVLRAQHLQAVVDMSKALDMQSHAQEIRAATAGLRDRAAVEMAGAKLKVQQMLAPQVSAHSAYIAPTPAQQLVLGRSELALRSLGVAPEQYAKFTEAPIGKSTVNATVQELKDIAQMRNFIGAVKTANGGELPGVDQTFDWSRLGIPREAAARWGLDKAKTAGQVYQRLAELRFNQAKQAGRVTEAELNFSKDIVGHNSSEIEGYLGREYDSLNNQVKGVAEGMFPGKGQYVTNTFLTAIGGVPGAQFGNGKPR